MVSLKEAVCSLIMDSRLGASSGGDISESFSVCSEDSFDFESDGPGSGAVAAPAAAAAALADAARDATMTVAATTTAAPIISAFLCFFANFLMCFQRLCIQLLQSKISSFP